MVFVGQKGGIPPSFLTYENLIVKLRTNANKVCMIRTWKREKGDLLVLVMFLLLIIGGFLLGFAAIFTTIMLVGMICGSYKGFTAICKTSSNELGKLVGQSQISTIRRLPSKAIEA